MCVNFDKSSSGEYNRTSIQHDGLELSASRNDMRDAKGLDESLTS